MPPKSIHMSEECQDTGKEWQYTRGGNLTEAGQCDAGLVLMSSPLCCFWFDISIYLS